jgi:N-acetylglucosamine kinase-like BadF-type ATPase
MGRVRLLAVDAGQSSVRALALAAGGAILGTGSSTGVIHGARPGAVAGVVKAITVACQEALGSDHGPDLVSIGLSGVPGDRGLAVSIANRLLTRIPAARILLASDSITAFLGAADGPGVVVAAGTGAVVVAADCMGRWARVDGRGAALGDLGSGYWIGRRGLEVALDEAEGRGGSAGLLAEAIRTFGNPDQIVDIVAASESPNASIAGFAEGVQRAAIQGDLVAVGILTDAGRELARSACAAADRVFPVRSTIDVTLTGGLANASGSLTSSFERAVHASRPGSVVKRRVDGPMQGAIAMAQARYLSAWFPNVIVEAGRQ